MYHRRTSDSPFIGRVLAVRGPTFLILTDEGEQVIPAAGRLQLPPVVGDAVSIRDGFIESVLPRRSVIQRIAPGRSREIQVLAANVDILFVVSGLDHDFNLRRLERYMVLALDSGAQPAFVLTKADLCEDAQMKLEQVRTIASAFPIILSSAKDGAGAAEMRRMIGPELTAVLIGSSGAGKSTLVNLLLGQDRQAVQELRANDGRGQHTTTHRQMFRIPGGGWLIDQPGIREIQITADLDTVRNAFPEVVELATQCRFRDCRHESEPGCAVRQHMDPARLRSYEKLRGEAEGVHPPGRSSSGSTGKSGAFHRAKNRSSKRS